MNRNYPPAPPPYGPPPQYRRPPPQNQSGPSTYAPSNVLNALINQSQRRHALYEEASAKLDAGFGHLQLDAENVLAMLAQRDPNGAQQLQLSLTAVIQAAQLDKQKLAEIMQVELFLQGEIRRWMEGMPPSDIARAALQQPPQAGWQQVPQQGTWPQQAPQQQAPQQQQAQGQQAPLPVPPAPQGPIDYRDPFQAAAAVLRAQPMPLGPIQQPPQGGVYVPPGSYGAPPPGTYGAPGYAQQPTPVPVQMQYAQPDQAGPPNMPMPPPVPQYQTPEAAQAAVNASHAAGVPAANVAPVAPANGASKNAST